MGGAGRDGASVLIVASNRDAMETLGFWFEQEGFDVLGCPGPADVHAACLRPDASACPLAVDADLVVLDLSPERIEPVGRAVRRGLIERYAGWGLPLLVLAGPDDAGAVSERSPGVEILAMTDRADVVWAATRLLSDP